MAPKSTDRLQYGPRKYAGLHLLLSRWLRLHGDAASLYCYVTLGGTDLRDIHSLRFVDAKLTTTVSSYEVDRQRHALAKERADQFAFFGSTVDLHLGNFFSYKRQSELPHIFFLDLPGICAWSDYDSRFSEMFQDEVIREGDCLLITSHLGHHPGLDEIRRHFSGEFAILRIDASNDEQVRGTYRRSHPTMTLFKALCLNSMQSELQLRCFGIVKYRDLNRTPMGIYGYAISTGTTDLATLVDKTTTNYFDVNDGKLCKPDDF
jgi:hypothetical protein